MSAFDTAWMLLKMPPLPRGAPIPGRVGETGFASAGPKKLTNRMSRHLGEGHDVDQEALKQFLMEHGDNPEVMDMLAGRFGMEPGSISFPGSMMPRDPHSSAPMPELPRGTPDLSMMQPDGARTPPPQLTGSAPDANTVPPAPAGDVGVGPAPAGDENAQMLLSQFSFEQLLNELMRRRGQE